MARGANARLSKTPAEYRKSAQRLRQLAATFESVSAKKTLLLIARQYDELAEYAADRWRALYEIEKKLVPSGDSPKH
jgi:hypothetical protein